MQGMSFRADGEKHLKDEFNGCTRVRFERIVVGWLIRRSSVQ